MTEALLAEIIEQAKNRWSLYGVTVIHRIGTLAPNDQIVFVGVATEHRKQAFDAAQFLMDYLKTQATLWKKVTAKGKEQWLDAKGSDDDAAAEWGESRND
jgi:molybdopterin synthase catalytic subunit